MVKLSIQLLGGRSPDATCASSGRRCPQVSSLATQPTSGRGFAFMVDLPWVRAGPGFAFAVDIAREMDHKKQKTSGENGASQACYQPITPTHDQKGFAAKMHNPDGLNDAGTSSI